MHDVSLESRDPAAMLEEIARLRGQVARLESQVTELDRLAHCDPLVPLANRRGMMRELETMIARHDRHGTPAAVLFVDLDDLKVLNDSFGHGGGDAALLQVARKLLEGTRANDCVARLGGDEFGILLDHADEKKRAGNRRTAGRRHRGRGFHVRGFAHVAVGRDRRHADRAGRQPSDGPGPGGQGDVPG